MIRRSTPLLTIDIAHCAPATLKSLIAEPVTPPQILDLVARRLIGNVELILALSVHPRLWTDTLSFLLQLGGPDLRAVIQSRRGSAAVTRTATHATPENGSAPEAFVPGGEGGIVAKEESLLQRIQHMTAAEKVQFAMRAGKDARSLLIRDANRQVALAVVHSPKLTEDEVIFIAGSRNVSDEVLREVARNKEWMKAYAICRALVNNPKAPVGITLPLLNAMQARDLGLLGKNKNLPEALRTAANRLLVVRARH